MTTRCGFVALVGAPNAGKSSLTNAIVGEAVTIVTRKAQTTRAPVRGVALDGEAQVIVVDTPGVFAPRRRLDRAMVDAAWGGASDADLVALVIDSKRGLDEAADAPFAKLPPKRAAKVLILNKIDLVSRDALLPLAAAATARAEFAETFMVSAETGDGIADLRRGLGRAMPEGPWLYPEDQVSVAPLRSLAAEIVRGEIFERMHDELPYHMTVETDSWEERPDGSARVEQTIFVARDGHKKMLIGAGGASLKAIGSRARAAIAEAAGHPIHLFLHVKVRERWEDDPERYREMGLDFPKG